MENKVMNFDWEAHLESLRHTRELMKENVLLMKSIEEERKETDRQMRETDRQMRETDRQMRETDLQLQETRRLVQEMSRKVSETTASMAELRISQEKTFAQMRETDKRYGSLSSEWGRMVEELCKPSALKLFIAEGVKVDHLYEGPRHVRRSDDEIEVDITYCNTTEVVAVEVKTTCYKKDVDYFLKQMKKFKVLFREFADKKVYVAMAALRFANGSDVYARRQGLYVLHPSGEGMFCLDKPNQRKQF